MLLKNFLKNLTFYIQRSKKCNDTEKATGQYGLALGIVDSLWSFGLWKHDTAISINCAVYCNCCNRKRSVNAFMGAIYSALIAFFPPLGIVLSILFFLLNLGTIAKSWRISLTSAYFYLVPLLGGILRSISKNEPNYVVWLFVGFSLLGLHFLLNWLYKNNSLSRTLTWSIICVPYAIVIMFLPTRFRRFKSNKNLKF